MKSKRISSPNRKELEELAASNEHVADALLIEDAELTPDQKLVASVLLASFRTIQKIVSYGVSFDDISPKLIIDFVQRGKAAIGSV